MDRRLLGPGLLTVASMLVFGTLSIVGGNKEFIYYSIVMVVLIAGVWAMDRRVRFSGGLLWALAVWGLLHMGGGNVPIPESVTDQPDKGRVLYNMRLAPWLPRYDQLIHAYGFFVATLAAWQALRATAALTTVSVGLAIGLACMGMGLGAFNEVVEFAATRVMPTNVGGYENTGWDLVSNMVGACAAAFAIWLRHRPAKPTPA